MNKIARFLMITLLTVVVFSAVAYAQEPTISISFSPTSGTVEEPANVTVNYDIDFGYTFGDYNCYVDGQVIGGDTYAGSGSYSSTASALSAGSHTFTITATNPQGFSTTVSENYDVNGPPIINTYLINITSDNGRVTKSPDKGSYNYGEWVELTATSGPGYKFAGWGGDDAIGNVNPLRIFMDRQKYYS